VRHLVRTVTPPSSAAVAASPAAAVAPEPAADAGHDAPPVLQNPAAAQFALGLAGFCCFLGVYATQPLLPTFERLFGVGKAGAGLTVSAATIAVALASPFSGVVARRHGHRRVIVASLLVLPLPMLLAATSSGIGALVGWRFLQGLVVPGIYAVTLGFIAEAWPAHSLGRAMSSLITGNVIGGFAGRLISGLAAERWGWRGAFVTLGLVTLAAGAVAVRLLPPSGRPRRLAPDEPAVRIRDLLGEPRLLATLAVGFNVLFTLVAIFTYVTFYLSAPPFHLGAGVLSSLFTVYLVGAAVTPFVGRWIDRVGSRAAITVSLLAGVGGGALTLSHSLWMVAAGLAVSCTAAFASQAASTSYLRVAAPARGRSAASGLYVSLYYLGGAAGGVLPALAWRAGGWPACVALAALVQLATLLLARRAWRGPARAAGPVPLRA
jgi:MFS transporter, YNFM family, putative membrane transport protein